jgi:hypothetical protein
VVYVELAAQWHHQGVAVTTCLTLIILNSLVLLVEGVTAMQFVAHTFGNLRTQARVSLLLKASLVLKMQGLPVRIRLVTLATTTLLQLKRAALILLAKGVQPLMVGLLSIACVNLR